MAATRKISLGILLLMSAGCVARSDYDRLMIEYESMRKARDDLEGQVLGQEQELTDLRGRVALAQDEASEARQDLQLTEAEKLLLEEELASMQDNMAEFPGVDVFRTDDGLAFRMGSDILFDSGKADIKAGARSTLGAIAREIVSQGFTKVRIDGHTDTDPVKVTADIWTRGNHELAMERALSVYEFLVDSGKVPPKALTLAAYGPNAPLPGADKSRNRRVEIHVKRDS